jgi:hypothetical protein
MDSWTSSGYGLGGFGGRSAITKDELLSYDFEQLKAAMENSQSRESRDDFLPGDFSRLIWETARENPGWGIKIAAQARSKEDWSSTVWSPIIETWVTAKLDQSNWTAILDVLDGANALYEAHIYNIAMVLEHGAAESAESPIPTELLEKAKSVARKIHPHSRAVETKDEFKSSEGWLMVAINHPFGMLTQFYLRALSRQKQKTPNDPAIASEYFEIFSSILDGDSVADKLGRVILSSTLYFLFKLDSAWVKDRFIPLFSATRNPRTAQQCLHGFLSQARWDDALLSELLPHYDYWFSHINDEPERIQSAFCTHLAGVAAYSLTHPLESGWLGKFLSSITTKLRITWAGQMHMVLRNLDDEAKAHIWNRWVKPYWEGRLKGDPLPLDPGEISEMVGWAHELGPVFPEVVDLICRSPKPDFGDRMAYYQFRESRLVEQHPIAVAKLLSHLAANEHGRPIYDLGELVTAVERLIKLIPSEPSLRNLCNELARLGASNALDLSQRLDRND